MTSSFDDPAICAELLDQIVEGDRELMGRDGARHHEARTTTIRDGVPFGSTHDPMTYQTGGAPRDDTENGLNRMVADGGRQHLRLQL